MIDEELRLLEREVEAGDLEKVFEIARVRGRAGLGPPTGDFSLGRRRLVRGEFFDEEMVTPRMASPFFVSSTTFQNGSPKSFGQHTNVVIHNGSLPVGYVMAVTGIGLIPIGPWTYFEMTRILEGWVSIIVGGKSRPWMARARDVVRGIKLEGPLVLEQLSRYSIAWNPPIDPFVDSVSVSSGRARLILTGVSAVPIG
jgi:hypothetical protein